MQHLERILYCCSIGLRKCRFSVLSQYYISWIRIILFASSWRAGLEFWGLPLMFIPHYHELEITTMFASLAMPLIRVSGRTFNVTF